jgi:hypothetical protein
VTWPVLAWPKWIKRVFGERCDAGPVTHWIKKLSGSPHTKQFMRELGAFVAKAGHDRLQDWLRGSNNKPARQRKKPA